MRNRYFITMICLLALCLPVFGGTSYFDFEDISTDTASHIAETPQISGWQFNSYYQVYDNQAHNLSIPQGSKALYINNGQAARIIENIRPNHIYQLSLAIAANNPQSAKDSFVALQAIKGDTFDTLCLVRFSDVLDSGEPTKFKYASLSFDASTREDLKGYPIRAVVISKTMVHIDDIKLNIIPNRSEDVLTLENDFVSFVFLGKNRGLTSMYDKTAGYEHINRVPGAGFFDKPLPSTLWRLEFLADGNRDSLSSRDFPCTDSGITTDEQGNQTAVMKWRNISLKNSPQSVNVEVRVTLPNDGGIASWLIDVDNNSSIWGLYDIKFPLVTGLLEAKKYDIAAPRKNIGVNHKDCDERLFFEYGEGWWGPGQFMCADAGGNSVYIAAHDGRAWPKNFVCEPGKEFFVQSYPKDTAITGADFNAPYPLMLGVYQGNWMKACKIYRKFAIDGAFWLAQGSNEQSNMPQSIKDMGIWAIYFPDTSGKSTVEQINKPIYEMQKALNTKIGVHWYNWHANVFDHQLPHYLPANSFIAECIREFANNEDIMIMPYINARVISCDIDDFKDYEPYLCRDENGNPYNELYGAAPNTLVMCPYTQMWQDKIYDITKRTIQDLKVKAIYLDQVSAAPIKLCYDKSHGHPLGGGDWWVSAYHKMLAKLREIKDHNGRTIVITTEFAAEPYIGASDNFLIWMARAPEDLPMLAAVYSGYTFYFGSNNYEPQENTWSLIQLRSAIWGIQNGWMTPDFILDPQNAYRAELMKKIAAFRGQAKKYLIGAELMDIIDHTEQIEVLWNGKSVQFPAMQAAVWKYNNTSIAIFIANYSDSPKQFSIELPLDKYAMDKTASYIADLQGDDSYNTDKGIIHLKKTSQSRTIDFIEFRME